VIRDVVRDAVENEVLARSRETVTHRSIAKV